MPSNSKYAKACPECYLGAGLSDKCSKCGGETKLVYFGTKITVPKKNDKRAWKRVFNGEKLWDRRKVKRAHRGRFSSRRSDTHLIWDTEKYEFELPSELIVYRVRRIKGSEREVNNYRCLPEIDLGG